LPLPEPAVAAFGESAVLVTVGGPDAAQALAASIRGDPPLGVTGSVPALDSVLVDFDPLVTDAESVRRAVLDLASDPVAPADGRTRTIPVVYGGDHGPDLPEVARLAGLSADAVIGLHAASELRVLFDGFAPGFAYLGDLPDAIRVPRLATPRTRTPRGSVAIAGPMSGIYPAELPGGWRVIGRTPIELFDPRREPPAYLLPGDRVRFVPMGADDWDRHGQPRDDW
jgi:KipI family sensor histidine kinase inhibitor